MLLSTRHFCDVSWHTFYLLCFNDTYDLFVELAPPTPGCYRNFIQPEY